VSLRAAAVLPLPLACALAGCAAPAPLWRPVTAAASLAGVRPVVFGGDGDVRVDGDGIVLETGSPLTGVTFATTLPDRDYELELQAARLLGTDFFCGLTFPTARGNLTLVLGGWGGTVCGLSCLDGADAAHNETRRLRSFTNGRSYLIRVRVAGSSVSAFVDGDLLLTADLRDRAVAVRAELELCQPFGCACYATRALLHSVRWRPLRR
jgi:hypothetical protein